MPYSIKRHGLSLANCDDEPVHTPGCIQGHGILMALRADDLRITQISENCSRWLGLAVGEVLDQPLAKFAGESVAERIRALVLSETLERNPSYVGTSRLTGTSGPTEPFDLTVHSLDSVLLLELEPSSRGEPGSAFNGDQFANIRRTIARLKLAQSLAAFCGFLTLDEARHARDKVRGAKLPADILIRETPGKAAGAPMEEEYWLRVRPRDFAIMEGLVGFEPAAVEGGEDTFLCSACGATVHATDAACPGCGLRFEE